MLIKSENTIIFDIEFPPGCWSAQERKKESPSVGSQRGGSGQPQDGLFNCIFPEVKLAATVEGDLALGDQAKIKMPI